MKSCAGAPPLLIHFPARAGGRATWGRATFKLSRYTGALSADPAVWAAGSGCYNRPTVIHHHGFLGDYSGLDSPVHRLPAALKVLASVGVVLAVVLCPVRVTTSVFLAVALVVVAAASRVPPFFLVKRVSMIEPVVMGAAVLALFQPGGGRVFGAMVVKSSLCVATMVLLSNTTPFADLLDVLRRLRVPGLLVTTIALMHRYLFVLGDEATRMRRACASRTFTRGRRHAWASLASVIARLFVRTNERAERIYAAMVARGWK